MESRRPKNPDANLGRRPTLKDVAKRAGGVHPSTVSLALRNHPGISATLKRKIKAAAEALGYRPDPLLDAFNTHRVDAQPRRAVNTIAWVMEGEDRRSILADPLNEHLWNGAKVAADLFRSQLEFFIIGPTQLTPQRLNGVLHARGITGVVLAGIHEQTRQVTLTWSEYCSVRVESLHLPEPLYSIGFDHRQGFRLAWRRLVDQGYHRIGLVLAPNTSKAVSDQILIGHRFEQYRLRPQDCVAPLFAESLQPEAVQRWQRIHSLDAVISNHPALISDLLRPPQAGAKPIAGVCLAGHLAPSWMTATVPDAEAAGAHAVEQLVMLLRNHERGHPSSAATTRLPFLWRAGDSVPARLCACGR